MLLHYRAGGLPALPELTAQWASKRRNPRSLVKNNLSQQDNAPTENVFFLIQHFGLMIPAFVTTGSFAPPITNLWIVLADQQALQHHLGMENSAEIFPEAHDTHLIRLTPNANLSSQTPTIEAVDALVVPMG